MIMSKEVFSRRSLLAKTAGIVPVCAFVPMTAKAADEKWVCADPAGGDRSLRDSLHFTEMSPNPKESCKACGLFHAEAGPGPMCGHCDIFNGPANANGRCDSWSAKA